MRIIDVHTHAWPDALAPGVISTLSAQGDIHARYDGTISGLTAAMDRTGVEASVVLPVATKPGQVATINDWIAATASARIVAFGAMHPDLPDPASEIARMRSLGLHGFKMHPEYQGFEPCEERLRPIYAAAVELGMVLQFHAGADLAFASARGTPEQYSAVLDEWPALTVVLAHMGGFRVWDAVARHLAGRDVWLDTAYTLGHLPDGEFVALARAHGCDRVLFGTDGPWTDADAEIAHLSRLPFTSGELAGILGGNAARLLGI